MNPSPYKRQTIGINYVRDPRRRKCMACDRKDFEKAEVMVIQNAEFRLRLCLHCMYAFKLHLDEILGPWDTIDSEIKQVVYQDTDATVLELLNAGQRIRAIKQVRDNAGKFVDNLGISHYHMTLMQAKKRVDDLIAYHNLTQYKIGGKYA
jgi:hypothetical protein